MADYAASYCERCGTRFTFGSSSSVGAPLKDARVLAKGLKRFVLSNSGSIGDAMAYARSDLQNSESSRITEMFRKTFNFCITCRQYACDNCWNEAQGACLSCAPESGIQPVEPADLQLVRTPVSRPESSPAGSTPREGNVPGSISMRPSMPAWPTQDMPAPSVAGSDGGEGAAAAASEAESARQVNRSLWPIQDDLDAERLDLTPEELALVEDQLELLAPHMLADSNDASSAGADRDEAAAAAEAELVAAAERIAAAAAEAEQSAAAAEAEQSAAAAEAELVAAAEAARNDAAERFAAESHIENHVEPEIGPWPSATPWWVRAIQSGGHVLGPIVVEQSGTAAALPATGDDLSGASVWSTPVETSAESTYAMETSVEPETIAKTEAILLPQWPGQPDRQFDAASQFGADTVDDRDWTLPLEQPTEPVSEPLTADAAIDAAPIETQPPEPVAIAPAPVQQPLFEAPPVSTDRWAANPAAWQPMGASWPAPAAPDAPWPGPDPSAIPAAIMAAKQASQPGGPAIWAASSEQVMSRGNVRACHHCALPVSTHARFCRRCGTEQA